MGEVLNQNFVVHVGWENLLSFFLHNTKLNKTIKNIRLTSNNLFNL